MQNYLTEDQIYQATLDRVAPLPCQEQYIRELASIFSYHTKKNILIDSGYDPQELPQQSVMVVAPSGQGKTHILQEMAKICKTNVITIDGSMLCKEGWKGVSLGQQLLAAKNCIRNDDLFERSIVFIDECDKLRQWNTEHDQSNAQVNLLQLYNAESLIAEGEGREPTPIYINRFTVILAGAFAGLEDIVRRRVMPQRKIGFSRVESKEMETGELIKMACQEDLVEYGMMRELIGRIGSLVFINPMRYEDYHQLILAENGYAYKYETFFSSFHGVSIEITNSAVKAIADACIHSTMGARAVSPMINDLMREAMSVVERDEMINKVVLDATEGNCCLSYEYGIRAETIIGNNSISVETMEPYVLEGTVHKIVAQLCDIYLETNGSATSLPELRIFLKTSLQYMVTEVNDEDVTFGALVKMAEITKDDMPGCKTTYEILIERAINEGTGSSLLSKYFEKYKVMQNPNTMRRVTAALRCIINYVYKNYHSNSMKFNLTERNYQQVQNWE